MPIHNPKSTIQSPLISLIAAMSENRVIGRGNQLPWHLPADLKRFKALTTGHAVIMGRKTLDSIGGKPLPNRNNIVVTRRTDLHPAGVTVAHDLKGAIALARQSSVNDEIFILGGSEIFKLAMPLADRIHLTLIHAQVEGDAYFPEIDSSQWELVEDERHAADEKNKLAHSFQRYERKR